MGTVHGVYLKYVGLSALSYAGYSALAGPAMLDDGRMLMARDENGKSILQVLPALIMGYSTLLNGAIAVLFKLETGMGLIGKDKSTGQIPLWSYLAFFPFHIPTIVYTEVHKTISRVKTKTSTGETRLEKVPVATEVQPGWYVGGCHGHELNKDWGGVIDLTVEFPESCRYRTKHYLSAPTWDGVPLSPSELEAAAEFGVNARKDGDVLVHCAHGRGRSTTVMCACLVKAGLYDTWSEAFDKGIKPFRTVCKLNKRMQENLTAWQHEYVDMKKAT